MFLLFAVGAFGSRANNFLNDIKKANIFYGLLSHSNLIVRAKMFLNALKFPTGFESEHVLVHYLYRYLWLIQMQSMQLYQKVNKKLLLI